MEPDHLERIVTLLDASTRDRGDDQAALLVRIVVNDSTPDGFELGWKDVDGHPTNSLLGLVAEDDWVAIGLIGHGTSYAVDDPADQSRRVRCRTTVLMTYDGSTYGMATFADGRVIDEPPTEGIVADCMRRVFGLATDPPQQTTAELFAVMWLDTIVGSRVESWEQASRLHPAVTLLAGTDLVAAGNAMAKVCNWSTVRELVTTKGWWNDLVPAEHVEWMGLGLLSRWLFGEFRPLPVLLADVERVCPPAVAGNVRRALIELGIRIEQAAA
ncbi:MAG: hypothetical protein JWO37_1711 [Acidimicrobiales bacterium]|jgi:hypothetical protein|nr:hypothetical protein [Acidimicrobiales bacterium]